MTSGPDTLRDKDKLRKESVGGVSSGTGPQVPIWPTAEGEEDSGHVLEEAFLQRPCGLGKSFLRKAYQGGLRPFRRLS